MTDIDDKPWYRQLWPWLLMIPPAGAVFGGVVTAWLAGGPPALVVDDYSEIALSTERDQARDRRAAELGLAASLSLRQRGDGLAQADVSLTALNAEFRPPAQLMLRIIHPTRETLDRDAQLIPAEGRYRGPIERPTGRLYVQLSDPAGAWRLTGELPVERDALQLDASAGGARPQ